MAIQIRKTFLELKLLSGGTSCGPIEAYIQETWPGYSLLDEVDCLEYTTGLRERGLSWGATFGFYRYLDATQRKQFLLWSLNKFMNYLPESLLKDELLTVAGEVEDCLDNPSIENQEILFDNANALFARDYSQSPDKYVVPAFAGVCLTVASDHLNGEAFDSLEKMLRTAGENLGQKTKTEAVDEILTELEAIVGLRD